MLWTILVQKISAKDTPLRCEGIFNTEEEALVVLGAGVSRTKIVDNVYRETIICLHETERSKVDDS